MNGDDTDSQLMNTLVRMVVPLRREFGRQLDVRQFLHDFAYAREVLDEALSSKDGRLLEYARYVQTRLSGPRIASAAPAPGPAAADKRVAEAAKPVAAPAAPAAPSAPTAEDMRAMIMKKYTDGLR